MDPELSAAIMKTLQALKLTGMDVEKQQRYEENSAGTNEVGQAKRTTRRLRLHS
jgi:hypothetical protein